MHILLVHQAFVSDQEAGGTRHFELAKYLVSAGHQVTVVAGTINYLSGKIVDRPTEGKSAVGFEGIRLRRAWTYTGWHQNFFTRFLGFLSFSISSFFVALRVPHVDIVWGTTPPLFQCITAYLLSRFKRVPYVLEVRDLWPDFAIELGILENRWLIWLSRRLERFLYRHAHLIVINSPGFADHLQQSGVLRENVHLIPNGVDVRMFDPDDSGEEVRRELDLVDKFVVLYAGAHGVANGLETLVAAAKHLEAYPKIELICVGDGKERQNLMKMAADLRLENLRFLPSQPKSQMPCLLAAADVCVAVLKPISLFKTTYPNKVFDYMAAGKPTILAIDGVIRDVIEDSEGGTFVKPGDSQEFAVAVLAYYHNPMLRHQHGQNARKYVTVHFNRADIARRLQILFENLIERKQEHDSR